MPLPGAKTAALLGLVFFASGFASLAYEVAWQRLLTVYYGMGPVSLAIIVSVYLFGLGLGGLAGGAMAERLKNLAGAYLLISWLGLDRTVYFASLLNFSIAGLVLFAFRLHRPGEEAAPAPPESPAHLLGGFAYPLVFITGFTAIGYEIIWMRIINVLVKDSPYAFATTLFVYLLGLGLGSLAMRQYTRQRPLADKRRLFFLTQFLAGASISLIVMAYYYLTRFTPFGLLSKASFDIDVHPSILAASASAGSKFLAAADILLWPAFFELVPVIFIGAGFPLISHLALSRPDREGAAIGRVYFSNTLGNLLGGLGAGFFILPRLGAEHTLLLFTAVNMAFGFFAAGKDRLIFSVVGR